jgi:hypothetical protein
VNALIAPGRGDVALDVHELHQLGKPLAGKLRGPGRARLGPPIPRRVPTAAIVAARAIVTTRAALSTGTIVITRAALSTGTIVITRAALSTGAIVITRAALSTGAIVITRAALATGTIPISAGGLTHTCECFIHGVLGVIHPRDDLDRPNGLRAAGYIPEVGEIELMRDLLGIDPQSLGRILNGRAEIGALTWDLLIFF